MAKVQAIIAAAGTGTRLKSRVAKPLIMLNGKPLLYYSLSVFEKSSLVGSMIIVGHSRNVDEIRKLVKKFRFKKVAEVVTGGKTRCESVSKGLAALEQNTEYVVVHDAARPFVSKEILEGSIKACLSESAAVVAVPVKSTIKKVDLKNLYVQETLVRDTLWEIQTPQVFRKDILVKAHQVMACSARCEPTDDAVLVEKIGIKVKIVKGDYRNIKVTTPEDFGHGQVILEGYKIMQFRVGVGYDVHRLVKGRKLLLGGVNIPFAKGLYGHSDADVVLHAICDAILGALGKGDIGEHFPNTDPRYKNISSLKLLKTIYLLAKEEGYKVNNVDTVILAEQPSLKNFKGQMRLHIARELAMNKRSVNIKATTSEGMGFVGQGKGMAAYATVSVIKNKR